MKYNAFLPLECSGWKGNVEEKKHLVPCNSFMDVQIFHYHRFAKDDDIQSQFLFELSENCALGVLAEIDAASKWTHTLYPALIIIDFRCQQAAAAPMQAQRLHSYSRYWPPPIHTFPGISATANLFRLPRVARSTLMSWQTGIHSGVSATKSRERTDAPKSADR